jgi:hypothetical protein
MNKDADSSRQRWRSQHPHPVVTVVANQGATIAPTALSHGKMWERGRKENAETNPPRVQENEWCNDPHRKDFCGIRGPEVTAKILRGFLMLTVSNRASGAEDLMRAF